MLTDAQQQQLAQAVYDAVPLKPIGILVYDLPDVHRGGQEYVHLTYFVRQKKQWKAEYLQLAQAAVDQVKPHGSKVKVQIQWSEDPAAN